MPFRWAAATYQLKADKDGRLFLDRLDHWIAPARVHGRGRVELPGGARPAAGRDAGRIVGVGFPDAQVAVGGRAARAGQVHHPVPAGPGHPRDVGNDLRDVGAAVPGVVFLSLASSTGLVQARTTFDRLSRRCSSHQRCAQRSANWLPGY